MFSVEASSAMPTFSHQRKANAMQTLIYAKTDDHSLITHHTHHIKMRPVRRRISPEPTQSIVASLPPQTPPTSEHEVEVSHHEQAPAPIVYRQASESPPPQSEDTPPISMASSDNVDAPHTDAAPEAQLENIADAAEIVKIVTAKPTTDEPSATVAPKTTPQNADDSITLALNDLNPSPSSEEIIAIASIQPLSHQTTSELVAEPLSSDIITATNEPEVRYFSGTNAPTVATPATAHAETAAPPKEDVAVAEKSISLESQNILNHLPRELFPRRHDENGKVTMDRSDPSQVLPTHKDALDTDVGASMQVRRQAFDIHYELEKAYHALLQGHTETAIKIYHEVLGQNPNDQHALFGLATTYHKLDRLGEAREYYGRLLTINPYHREALNNFLGLVAQESPDSAILYLEQLKQHNADFSPISAQLAQIYSAQGKFSQAIQHMQDAVYLSPDNLIYQYNLAVMYDMHGEGNRASVIYQRLVRAGLEGKEIPASLQQIQERLTFLSSNG